MRIPLAAVALMVAAEEDAFRDVAPVELAQFLAAEAELRETAPAAFRAFLAAEGALWDAAPEQFERWRDSEDRVDPASEEGQAAGVIAAIEEHEMRKVAAVGVDLFPGCGSRTPRSGPCGPSGVPRGGRGAPGGRPGPVCRVEKTRARAWNGSEQRQWPRCGKRPTRKGRPRRCFGHGGTRSNAWRGFVATGVGATARRDRCPPGRMRATGG